MNRMKVVFLTYGTSPVPATKGGAVEKLIEDSLDENEKQCNFEFSVLNIYEDKAFEKSKEYKHSSFHFVKCSNAIEFLAQKVYWFEKNILKKGHLISYRYIFRRLYVMLKYPQILLENVFDRVIVVTNSTLFLGKR